MCAICGSTKALSGQPSLVTPADTFAFASLLVGTPVMIKQAVELQAVFSSPTSQWTRELGRKAWFNVEPRLSKAGQWGTVVRVDPNDRTVQVQVSDGGKAWYVLFILVGVSLRSFCDSVIRVDFLSAVQVLTRDVD